MEAKLTERLIDRLLDDDYKPVAGDVLILVASALSEIRDELRELKGHVSRLASGESCVHSPAREEGAEEEREGP